MNASDIIRMRNANTQFSYYKKNVLSKQANCYSDNNLDLSGCTPIQYSSYAQKYLLKEGAKDLSGYMPPPPPTYNSKLGFYVLGEYDGYDNYQYRFYDGWGPLIDSGINVSNYEIYISYYGLGFQYAHLNDGEGNVRLQILDSTGKIINTIAYKSNDYAGYYNGERYGILCYQTPSGTNTFVFIDPLHNTTKTFTTSRSFYGSAGVTGSDVSFVVYDGFYYFYIWPAGAEQPYVASVSVRFQGANTPEIMDHFAFVTGPVGYDTVCVLLANGTFLSYTFTDVLGDTISYDNIDISYYGIDNSRLYVIGDDTNVYLFTLNATDFMNPIKILGFETPNGYNIVTHIDLNKNYLTAQNNHFGIYLYANDSNYPAPFFDATFIAVFENGSSNSNDYSSSAFAICDYVGLNSNGFTLFGYSNDTQLISYTITSNNQYTRVLTSNTIDTTANYDIVCENLNDYIYFDIYSYLSGSNTTHRGFIIDSKNTTAPSSVTYSNNNNDEIVTVASGNSLCRTSTEDTRLTYFNNPVDGLVIDTTTADIYYGDSGFYVFSSYPDLASGVIYSLTTDNTANILTSNTYTSNITTTGLDIINNAISLINFSDNVSILASNDGYLFYVYNVDSNGTINQSESITNELYNYTYINTPTTVIWPVTNNSCNVSYTSYNITTHEFTLCNDNNLYNNNYVIRTNNYYSWLD